MSTRLAISIALSTVIATGCSIVLDKNTTQCSTDADCEHFGGHPSCQQGVCVNSGLGPPGCFFGTPTTQAEFANQCTTAETFQFDNCARLGLCDPAAVASAFDVATTPANGTIPPQINNQTMPTVNCVDVAPNMIYITGSTNLTPLIKAVQPLLYAKSPPYVAVFAPQTSCKGAGALYDANPTKHLIFNTTNNWAFYFGANGTQTFCLLDVAGTPVTVGESDVYAASCGFADVPGIADYVGPIQAITFVVPSGSTQRVISAEAAHLVFAAAGNNGKAAPWTDPTLYFIRSSGTGTNQISSRVMGVVPTKWWGLDRLSAPNLVDSMLAIDPHVSEGVIGTLSSDFADKSRANLRELAFQQQGQLYGYLADSNTNSFDKANVRDGHYAAWGAIHLFAATTNGVPSQAAGALVTQFTIPKLDEQLVSASIDAGFVPPCAMKVTHSVEVGPLSAFTPQFGCGCFYQFKVNGASTCKPCGGPGDCSASTPKCNYGYCEQQ